MGRHIRHFLSHKVRDLVGQTTSDFCFAKKAAVGEGQALAMDIRSTAKMSFVIDSWLLMGATQLEGDQGAVRKLSTS